MTNMTPGMLAAIQAWWLAETERGQRELDARLQAWRDGYRAAELARADDYERGVYDGITGYKHATKDIMAMARLQILRYGPHSRQFTDPAPEDFPHALLATGGGE